MEAEALRFTLIWQGREIEVSFVPAWLNTGYDHIELRCSAPLPVTSTGYRSRFIATSEIAGKNDLHAFIHEWLEAAADNPDWRTYVEESRQLKLF